MASAREPDHTDPEETGVVGGTHEGAEPKVDTDEVGPDGTVYDDEALDEADRKMKLDGT